MLRSLSFARGLGVGAALMYFLDPNRGRYRRALVRDQMIRLTRELGDFCDVACRDLQNRWMGTVAEARAMFSEGQVSDQVLVDRVRSQMGRCVSHPRNIEVMADNGRVTLRGPILMREAEGLVQCVRSIRGVNSVRNELEIHEQAGNLPALQGGQILSSSACSMNWSPASRMIAGAAGGLLLLRGLSQSFPRSCISHAIGMALVGQAYLNGGVTSGRSRSPERSTGQRANEPSSVRGESPVVL